MNIPEELKYTKDHLWVRIDDNIATVGLTDYAQSTLAKIAHVDIDRLDETLDAGEVFGSIGTTNHTTLELLMPMDGYVLEINDRLRNPTKIINNDPYGKGWIIKIDMTYENDIEGLLSAEEYKKTNKQQWYVG